MKIKSKIYTDLHGNERLISQGLIPPQLTDRYRLATDDNTVSGYIYLRWANVVESKLSAKMGEATYNDIRDNVHQFVGKNKIYASNGSEIWR